MTESINTENKHIGIPLIRIEVTSIWFVWLFTNFGRQPIYEHVIKIGKAWSGISRGFFIVRHRVLIPAQILPEIKKPAHEVPAAD